MTDLRLENIKLKERLRKMQSKNIYSSIFKDYEKEITILQKNINRLQKVNKILTVKNVKLKHKLTNEKILFTSSNSVYGDPLHRSKSKR